MKDADSDTHKWFQDDISPDMTVFHSLKEVIYTGRSKFQSIDVINTGGFGVCLILDGKIQSSQSDEFIYHEALVHPAMIAHSNPERVFIAGGGEGATLREVLAHKTVRKVTMVDIDEQVVNVCRQFLGCFHQNSFDDPRAEICFSDARQYLEQTDDKFDVMIIDLPDPLEGGPASFLYTQEFYRIVKQRLRTDGIISVQAEPAGWSDLENFTSIAHTLSSIFPIASPYLTYIPSFTDAWGFVCASESVDPTKFSVEEIDTRISMRVTRELKSYDGLTHHGMFIMPKHIRQRLAAAKKIITDERSISVYERR